MRIDDRSRNNDAGATGRFAAQLTPPEELAVTATVGLAGVLADQVVKTEPPSDGLSTFTAAAKFGLWTLRTHAELMQKYPGQEAYALIRSENVDFHDPAAVRAVLLGQGFGVPEPDIAQLLPELLVVAQQIVQILPERVESLRLREFTTAESAIPFTFAVPENVKPHLMIAGALALVELQGELRHESSSVLSVMDDVFTKAGHALDPNDPMRPSTVLGVNCIWGIIPSAYDLLGGTRTDD